jgi:hypothetical protein
MIHDESIIKIMPLRRDFGFDVRVSFTILNLRRGGLVEALR